jgi:hypothetical protein
MQFMESQPIFGRTCRFHLQGQRINYGRNQCESKWLSKAGFLLSLFFDLKDGGDMFL